MQGTEQDGKDLEESLQRKAVGSYYNLVITETKVKVIKFIETTILRKIIHKLLETVIQWISRTKISLSKTRAFLGSGCYRFRYWPIRYV